MRRLFFALWPSDILREKFTEIGKFYLANQKAKPVHIDNLHITLVFLGNVSESQGICFEDVADSVIFKPFELQLDHIDYWRRSQILWLGHSKPCKPLETLLKSLNEKLVVCGFKAETRPYRAHVTLARKFQHRQFRRINISHITWAVENIHLMESVNSSAGVKYKILHTWTGKS